MADKLTRETLERIEADTRDAVKSALRSARIEAGDQLDEMDSDPDRVDGVAMRLRGDKCAVACAAWRQATHMLHLFDNLSGDRP